MKRSTLGIVITMRRHLSVIALGLLSLCLVTSQARGQKAEDVYQTYAKLAAAQAQDDMLIGVWSGSLCGKRILLAVISNDEQNGFKLKAVLVNGKEVGYGFKNGDTWFYVSPLAAENVYEGKTLYRNRLFKRWYPNRVVITDENAFTALDDVTVLTCGPTRNVYVRKEPRPKSDTETTAKLRRSGSGFLLRETAFIVTAYHVVEGASRIAVRFPSGATYSARVAARDINNDLAVLSLLEFTPSQDGFRISLQSSLAAGDPVHALGFPLVSTLSQQPSIVSGEVSSTVGLDDSPTQFRMTTPVNPGNSGGPILNQEGDVVGIAVAALRGRPIEGISFGIKVSTALPLFQQVGLKLSDKGGGASMTASQLFAASSKYVVLVEAN